MDANAGLNEARRVVHEAAEGASCGLPFRGIWQWSRAPLTPSGLHARFIAPNLS